MVSRGSRERHFANGAIAAFVQHGGFEPQPLVPAPVREAFDLWPKVRVLPIHDLSAVWGEGLWGSEGCHEKNWNLTLIPFAAGRRLGSGPPPPARPGRHPPWAD